MELLRLIIDIIQFADEWFLTYAIRNVLLNFFIKIYFYFYIKGIHIYLKYILISSVLYHRNIQHG